MLESPPLQPSHTSIVLRKVDAIAHSVSNSTDFLQQLFQLMSSVVRAECGHLWQPNGNDLETIASFGAESDRVDDERLLVQELGNSLVPTYYFFGSSD